MYVLCVRSNMAWFTPGELYTGTIKGEREVLICSDDAVSDLSRDDAWRAVRGDGDDCDHALVFTPLLNLSAEFLVVDALP